MPTSGQYKVSFKNALVVVSMVFSFASNANEHGEAPAPAAAEHGAAPAEGAKKKPVESDPKSEISALESDVAELKSRNQLSLGIINTLIQKKQSLPEKSTEIKEIITQINQEYKKLKTGEDKLREKLNLLKYKYPERANAQIVPSKTKSIKELEEDFLIKKELEKSLKSVKNHFGQTENKVENSNEKNKKSQETKYNPLQHSLVIESHSNEDQKEDRQGKSEKKEKGKEHHH